MKPYALLFMLAMLMPLMSRGQQKPETPCATSTDTTRISLAEQAPAVEVNVKGLQYPPDTAKQKKVRKARAKDFPKPKVSKKTSKRRAKKAKIS